MRQMMSAALVLLMAMVPLAASADAPGVAVLYFDYDGPDAELSALRKGLAQMLVSDRQGGQVLAPAAAGIVCPKCSASVAPGRFCSACGCDLKAAPAATAGGYCTGCGSPLSADAKFCGQCGGAA